MKKLYALIIITTVIAGAAKQSHAQSGQKFSSGGNTLSSGEFLGVNNAYPLIIKVNAQEWIRITETGILDVSGNSRFHKSSVFDSSVTALQMKAKSAEFATALVTGNLTAGTVSTGTISATNGSLAVDVNSRKLHNSSGNMKVDWENGQLWNAVGTPPSSSMISIDWNQRKLFNSIGNVKIDWEQGYLYNAAPGNVVSLKWVSRELIGFDGFTPSMDWGARRMFDGTGIRSLDWQNRYLLSL